MRRRSLNLSAAQTAIAVGVGNFMICGCFLLLGLPREHYAHRFHPFGLIGTSLILVAVGFFISLRCESDLKEGIANQRWDSAEIERIRNVFQSGLWKAFSIGLIVAAVVVMCVVGLHHPALSWIFLVPSMTSSRLTMMTKRPRTPKPPIDWRSFGPVRSDHWGQR